MTSSITRGGYEPLPEMGEYVCDCYEHGTGEPWAHVGSGHVHEQVVRCRDCVNHASDPLGEYCTLFDFEDVNSQKMLDGFCAWGERRKDA